jgi:DNA-binding response OmpR family regulator
MERPPSLLLVDDECALRGLVACFLRQAGYRVVEAEHGLDGVRRFGDDGPFGLVLMDLNMPTLDGVEACRRIRLLDPGQPILIVSAAVLPDQELALLDLGIDQFLTKPYHPETLLARARHLLASPRSRWPDAGAALPRASLAPTPRDC